MRTATSSYALLERHGELAQLDLALGRVAQGAGGLIAVEGPGGIGKSRLLAATREHGLARGMRVLTARGSELEQSFSFGVVRQLLEPPVLRASEAERGAWLAGAAALAAPVFASGGTLEEPAEEVMFPRLHGLYWLCANLAGERPLVLVVDDLQWADEPSVAFLGFLARRVEALSVGLAVASRPVERGPDRLAELLLAEPAAVHLRPQALSDAATAELVRTRVGMPPDEEFCRVCRHVTGGNPFLLGELLREVAAEGIEAIAQNADRLRALGPRGVSRVMLVRLARLPPAAARLAQAVAVLGDRAEARDAAELAELDQAGLAEAAAMLGRAEILRQQEGLVRFVHPIVRNTIYEELEPRRRQRAHGLAARLRHGHGAPPEEVGAHLLIAEPASDPWVVERLREAGQRALSLGDPQLAARLLERALDEPPAEGRAALLAELAHAEAWAGRASAAERFREAIVLAEDARSRVLVARELAGLMMFGGRPQEAATVLREVRRTLGAHEHELDEVLQVGLIGGGYLSLSARAELSDVFDAMSDPGRPAASLLEAVHLAGLALDAVMSDAPAEVAVDIALRALWPELPTDPIVGGNAFLVAVVALVFAERLSLANKLYTGALSNARERGNVSGVAAVSALRAMAAYRQGSVLDAEADAHDALDVEASTALREVALAYALLAGLERGASAGELDALSARSGVIENPDAPPYSQLLYARALVALERGDHERAAAICRSCDRPDLGWGRANPSVMPWRSSAARALAALGRGPEAARLAAEEVELARGIGTPRSLGMALRVAGLLESGERGRALLAEAVEVLAGSEG